MVQRQPARPAAHAAAPLNPAFLFAALVVLMAAAVVRIPGAGAVPPWTDEGWSIWATGGTPFDTLATIAADRHPPLFFLLLDAGRALFGVQLIALRIVPIAVGLLTVAVVIGLARAAAGTRAGVYAGAIAALLPVLGWYALELRPYGLLALLTAASAWAWLRTARRPTVRRALVYALLMAAALYTNYFALFPLLVQAGLALVTLGRARPPLRARLLGAWALAGVGAAFAFAPWAAVIIGQQWAILQSGISGFPGTLPARPDALGPLASLMFGGAWPVLVPLTLVGAVASTIARPRPLSSGPVAASSGPVAASSGRAVVWSGPLVFVLLFGLALRFDFLAARTLVMVVPLLAVTAGVGLDWLTVRARPRTLLRPHLAAAAVLAVVALLTTAPVLAMPPAERWNGVQPRLPADRVAAALAPLVIPGDLIILEAGWDDHALGYTLEHAFPAARVVRTIAWTDRFRAQPVVPQIAPLVEGARRVWAVHWLQAPQALPWLREGGAACTPLHDLTVDVSAYGGRFGAPTVAMFACTRTG